MNHPKAGENAPAIVKIEKTRRVRVKAFFRPMTSAMPPQMKAPKAMPMRLAVAIHAAWPTLRSQWSLSSGMRNPLSATSQASNMNPRPPMMKMAPWVRHFHGRWAMTSEAVGTDAEVVVDTTTQYPI